MQIKNRLTIQFSAIVFLLLVIFSLFIYYTSYVTRYNNFNQRLTEKALNTVKLLVEVEEIDERLLKEIRRNYLVSLPDEFVRIYDHSDHLVFSDDTVKFRLTPEQLRQTRLHGSLDFKKGRRQVVAIDYQGKYIITSSAINTYGEAQLNDLRNILISGILISLTVILITGRFFAIQSLKPISKIIQEVEQVNDLNMNLRLDEGNRKDEISKLAMSFNDLFNRIQISLENQNRFIANASHELRTPLTSITGEIEVSLMKDRSKEEYIEVLLSVLEEAKVLTKLSNGLLQLAQAGQNKMITVRDIEIPLILEELYDEVNKRNYKNPLILELKCMESVYQKGISGNKELLKMALLNVIDNAFKFSDFQSVTLAIESTEKYIIFTIEDKGIGINTTEFELIATPFYRSEAAINIEGHGIGLSLTNKIIKLHDGKLEFISEKNVGTIIKIMLPAKNFD